MTGYITCIDCGKEVERRGSSHKRCSRCAKYAKRIQTLQSNARNRAKPPITLNCLDCGMEVERKSNGQKRCADCAAERKISTDRESKARRLAKIHAEWVPPTLMCIDCGIETERSSGTQKRCLDCREAARRKHGRERAARLYAKNPGKFRARAAKYRSENHELVLQRLREYEKSLSAERRKALLAYRRELYRENPERARRAREGTKSRDALVGASRSGLPWTCAEDAVVIEWTGGLRELGSVLGRTRQAVHGRRQLLRKRAAQQAANTEGVNP